MKNIITYSKIFFKDWQIHIKLVVDDTTCNYNKKRNNNNGVNKGKKSLHLQKLLSYNKIFRFHG